MKRLHYSGILLLILAGCVSIPAPHQRQDAAAAMATSQGWQSIRIPAGRFQLMAYHRPWSAAPARLTIYIEGDGLAWITATTPSADPTPVNPLGLRLALAQPRGQVAYLARPCQYSAPLPGDCQRTYWTDRRFSEEVIDATDQAVSQLAAQAQADRLTLVGYSGGGAVAALVAARRKDVDRLVTVAGNLDTAQWTAANGLSPLTGSLNPADAAERLQQLQALRQWHFSGDQDEVVATATARSYAARFGSTAAPMVDVIHGYRHQCCWADNWPTLLARIPFWEAP